MTMKFVKVSDSNPLYFVFDTKTGESRMALVQWSDESVDFDNDIVPVFVEDFDERYYVHTENGDIIFDVGDAVDEYIKGLTPVKTTKFYDVSKPFIFSVSSLSNPYMALVKYRGK